MLKKYNQSHITFEIIKDKPTIKNSFDQFPNKEIPRDTYDLPTIPFIYSQSFELKSETVILSFFLCLPPPPHPTTPQTSKISSG